MRHPRYLLALFLIASCASSHGVDPQQKVLSGVFTLRACPSAEYYSGVYATLLLDSPMFVDGIGQVDSVELILNEPEFVHYQTLIGKRGRATCSVLTVSHLCGPAVNRASCGVTHVKIAP